MVYAASTSHWSSRRHKVREKSESKENPFYLYWDGTSHSITLPQDPPSTPPVTLSRPSHELYHGPCVPLESSINGTSTNNTRAQH